MTNLYQTAYDLINHYIFGNTAVLGEYPDLICVLGGTAFCAIAVALPFVVVKKVIELIAR